MLIASGWSEKASSVRKREITTMTKQQLAEKMRKEGWSEMAVKMVMESPLVRGMEERGEG